MLLLGEAQDVDSIEIILKTLSYLQKYDRPFRILYNLTHKKPHKKFLLVHEDPFKHTTFLVPVQRLALLDKMIKQRSNLVYEIYVHGKEPVTNIPEYTQETFLAVIKQALEERGWSPRLAATKYGVHYVDLKKYLEAQKNKVKTESPIVDRWFNELKQVWKIGNK